MREGLPFYYLPDIDGGPSNSIFVPFMGVPTATLPMVSRLAGCWRPRDDDGDEQTRDGYVVHVEPPGTISRTQRRTRHRTDEPGDRAVGATAAGQYLWTHRRFKTRRRRAVDLLS